MIERFWAKTGQGEFQNGSPKYHPVICHLADTAAVAMEIVREYFSPVTIATLESGLGLTGESLVKCCGFLAGCHDLGKVSPAFQFQVSEVGKALAGGELYDLWHKVPTLTRQKKAPHGIITAKTLPDFLVEIGLKQTLANKLAILVGGHHGFFPSSKEIGQLDDALAGIGANHLWWQRKYSHSIFEQLLNFVGLTSKDLPTQCDNAAAMILAGLTTVSDWIASNPEEESGFPYISDDKPFTEYTQDLNQKAKQVLKTIGWTSLPTGKPLSFAELFPEIKEPRELQKQAIAVSETLNSPCLFLIEASMGEGKTEAAFYLADYLQQKEGTGGFYIGLPTQATSNAMFERVKKFLGSRYSKEEFSDFINLTLSHSAASLQEDYQSSICRLDYQEQVYDNDDNDSSQRVVAREWHTGRRKSLLSPYGVGTLDQALMGALQSKWQFVRLFALAGRTVILDEIHAYDLYTGTLLERFLEWLALLGSPVIALSATLPSETRQRLVHAYAKGCGCKEELEIFVKDYPRLTTYAPDTNVQVISFPPSPHVMRDLYLRWVSDETWMDTLTHHLKDGGCVAVICSTVGRAQEVFHRLKSSSHFSDDELELFHGRFLFADREDIEKRCIAQFGKPSDPKTERPHRFVLVATQVIEQSLDLDFDLMVSDLAPVDLLLQRSGRLHRHEDRKTRPSELQKPMLWLIEPKLDAEGKADFGDARWIYDRHVLLRTWLTLRDCPSVSLPVAMDKLIESVYNPGVLPPKHLAQIYIEDWQDTKGKHQNDQAAYRSLAEKVYLPSARGKHQPCKFTEKRENDDDNAIVAVTRIGEESVTTIFLQRTDAGLILPRGDGQIINLQQTPDFQMIRALLANSTRINKKELVEALKKHKDEKPIKTWTSALLKYCCYVELDAEGKAQIDKWKILLDPKRGIVINSA
jgi:CRISPR-associated endonuclease/helicase Cas3